MDGAQQSVFDRLDERLRKAVSEVGYTTPTPIQEKAIPSLLDGRDLIGCAQTGTGKTAAFLLPILDGLLRLGAPDAAAKAKGKAGHPRALILSPTRELAAQTFENFTKYAKHANMRGACLFGGVNQFSQVKDIRRGADVVIATPGRLIDLMTQGVLYLDRVAYFVLDEADRMLDMGFIPDVRRIISKLPVNRQSMFFSATLAPEVLKLAGELVKDPVQVMISPERPTVDAINQKLMSVERSAKDSLLVWLLDSYPELDRVIVFARTRHSADRVLKRLLKKHIAAASIHSDKTQAQRIRALSGFKKGDLRVLVATDIASRGIDVPEVDLVVQMELPLEPESYVHRIGRTARAGKGGLAIAFVAPEERILIKQVERFIRKTIPFDRDHPFHVDVGSRDKDALPLAPWIKISKKRLIGSDRPSHGNPSSGRPKKKHSKGRRQPDFGQKARFS